MDVDQVTDTVRARGIVEAKLWEELLDAASVVCEDAGPHGLGQG